MTKTKNPDSWFEYIKTAASKDYDPGSLKIEEVQKLLSINQQYNPIYFHSIPLIYLADYTSGKYLLVSNTTKFMVGYDHEEFLKGGIELVMSKYQKDDLKLFDERIFPDRLKILRHIPVSEHSKYIFTYSFRLKHKNGEYNTLLQRNCFIKSDDNGRPLLSFGMVMNVTHFTLNNPVIQLVEKINPGNFGIPFTPYYKKVYYLNEEDKIFSARQKEILLWMTEGLTSKQIADKLFISEHTVINHRKNMLLKSGLNNSTALINFALTNKII